MKHTKHWKYLKWSAITFWGVFLLFVIIVNTGCTKIVEVEKVINNTIIYNNTIIINKTEPCNYLYDRSYVLGLIRQIKYLENQQANCINVTMDDLEDCEEDYEDCEDDLDNKEDELDNCEDALDDVEDELVDCEDELCDLNSSWC